MKTIIKVSAFLSLVFATPIFARNSDYDQVAPKERAEIEVLRNKRNELSIRHDSLMRATNPDMENALEAVGAGMNLARQIASIDAKMDSLYYIINNAQLDILEQRQPPLEPADIETLYYISSDVYHDVEIHGALRDRLVAVYERLDEEQKGLPALRSVSLFLFPLPEVKVGDMMADATLPDLEGNMHTLSDYLGKDKYLLLDFWASWCGPCLAALPTVKAVSQEYENQLTVIGINVDDTRDDWARVSEEHGITWLDLHTPYTSELTNSYRVSGYPYTVLIAPDGMVVSAEAGRNPYWAIYQMDLRDGMDRKASMEKLIENLER